MHVTPPAHPTNPVTAYIIDYGNTSRLALPSGGGGEYSEYGYGDWSWYCLGNHDRLTGAAALAIPTRAGLARRRHPGGDGAAHGLSIPEAVQRLHSFEVSGDNAEALVRTLDARFERPGAEHAENPERRMSYVDDPSAYWWAHQSSTVMTGWLRELGCSVRGWTLIADYCVHTSAD